MSWQDEFVARVKKGAEKGDPESMFHYGTSFGNDSPKALPWIEKAAAAGWGQAISTLGSAWTHGTYGAGVDIPKGIAYFEKAIAAGETTWAGQPLAKHLQKAKLALKRSGGPPVDPVTRAFADAKLTGEKEKILAAQLPSVRWLAEARKKDDLPLGASKLGGRPDLPTAATWPNANGRAMEHVATIDLASLPAIEGVPKRSGRLLFFIDAKNLLGDDKGAGPASAVLHVSAGAEVTRVKAPKGTQTFKPSSLAPVVEMTIPAFNSHACVALALGKKFERYLELLHAWPRADGEIHRSFGHGDVEHESDEPEPTLLLQVDSYSHGNIMWGDAGKLFWWITPADLKASRFERAVLAVHY
ncbi:MAG: DUF1963 domain-containing protein [Myxococcales bacterium]|nr:DUF1963 domain-containing protein [Myxococcales bacterium]